MTQRVRGFEWTKDFQNEKDEAKKLYKIADRKMASDWEAKLKKVEELDKITLPTRSTGKSAGYDFMANQYVTVPSIWKQATKFIYNKLFNMGAFVEEKIFQPTLVPTGVKAYMPEDEFLALYNRSSNPRKRFLLLANGVGIIDKDYYGNVDNDGHIMFQFINFGISDVTIKPGDVIGQGIFQEFRKTDMDSATGERTGGFGSTDSEK